MKRLGVWSASAMCVIGVAYAITLAVGFTTAGFAKPILDPVLAVMEILTLLSVILAGLTSSVHFVELTAVRQSSTAALTWPSTAYALELLGWDMLA